MANLGWSFAQRAAGSSASWIATKPILVLSLVLCLILVTNAVSGWYVWHNMNRKMISQLKTQAEEYEKKSKEKEQEFQEIITPLKEERDALKNRIVKIAPAKPPANESELVKRFKALGY